MVPRAVAFTIVWPEGVIFGSIMTYHVQFLLLVRQPLFDRAALPLTQTSWVLPPFKCWQNDTKTLRCIKLQPWSFKRAEFWHRTGLRHLRFFTSARP